MNKLLNVGIVGTGYVANKRAEAITKDPRARLMLVSGNTPKNVEKFALGYSLEKAASWWDLVNDSQLDLVFVSTVNRDHGKIVRACLEAGKNVVVEYPLSLDPLDAKELIELARSRGLMLHIEHLELLGGVHLAIKKYLPQIGNVFYTRYVTISPQRSIGQRWTYHQELFGFPLIGALSRIHRITDLFGSVESVACLSRFWWGMEPDYYKACLCQAQLKFSNNLIAEVTYGKGETFWQASRNFELHGENGLLMFVGEEGHLIRGEEKIPLEVQSKKGLIAQDTILALDHLLLETPLYVTAEESYRSLKVAHAAYLSTIENQMIYLNDSKDTPRYNS